MKKFNRKEVFKAVDESNKRFDTMSKEERQKLRDEIKIIKNSPIVKIETTEIS